MAGFLRKVLILDNNVAFRDYCQALLAVEKRFLVVEADDSSVLELLPADEPSIVLLGPNLAWQRRSQVLNLLALCWPTCRVILIDEYPGEVDIVNRLGASAVGILGCDDMARFLVKAVHKVYEGEAWVPRKLVNGLVERLRAQA